MGERHKITPEDRAKSHASRRAKKQDIGASSGDMLRICRDSLYRELMANPSASGVQALMALNKAIGDDEFGSADFDGLYSYENRNGCSVLKRRMLFELPGAYSDLGTALCARLEHFYGGKKELFAWDEESQMALIEMLQDELECHRRGGTWVRRDEE